jgi:tetratricopeptide (TPR) repeat protein
MGHQADTASYWTTFLRLDPKLTPAFTNRGLAYERKGSYDRAVADYNEAIRLNPTDAASFRGRAKVKINEHKIGHVPANVFVGYLACFDLWAGGSRCVLESPPWS